MAVAVEEVEEPERLEVRATPWRAGLRIVCWPSRWRSLGGCWSGCWGGSAWGPLEHRQLQAGDELLLLGPGVLRLTPQGALNDLLWEKKQTKICGSMGNIGKLTKVKLNKYKQQHVLGQEVEKSVDILFEIKVLAFLGNLIRSAVCCIIKVLSVGLCLPQEKQPSKV
jgi:hypothetical protein